jgi:AmmeMemoRadiSam system protein B
MQIRRSIVAHQFYPGRRDDCVAEIEQCLAERGLPASLPDGIVAGIVPHAGWVFSGALAAMVFAALKRQYTQIDVFVILGTAHSDVGSGPVVGTETSWETPLGQIDVAEDLVDQLVKAGRVGVSRVAHRSEHSVEVQVPFVQYCYPGAQLCPIVVPASLEAIPLGEWLGQRIRSADRRIVCLGSTDLTHYGPQYGFVPMGRGREGIHWAAQVNDRRFIDLALNVDPGGLLAGASENAYACGPGAAAAAVAAAKAFGKTSGQLLAYTNSHRVMADKMEAFSPDSVGYAAMVF